MPKIIFLLLAASFYTGAFSQMIDYNVPPGYKKIIKKEEYKKIIDITLPILSKRYTIENVKEGTVYFKAAQELQVVGLTDLIAKCVQVKDQEKWGQVIEGHFSALFAAMDQKKNLDIHQFETIREHLSIRIYPQEMIDRRGGVDDLVVRTDLEGTYTLLMLDLQSAFTPVQQNVFQQWNKNLDEVFKVAQNNINKNEMVREVRQMQAGKSKVEAVFIGNEDYAASYALDLQHNLPDDVGEWGSVVAMPNKGIVNICKITKAKPLDFVQYIQLFKKLVAEFYNNHQQPVSDQFYWYYKGKFTLIQVTEDAKGSVNVVAPLGLSELMTKEK